MKRFAGPGLLILLMFLFLSCQKKENVYIMETEMGTITFQVFPGQAPITVANFLQYVEQAKFEDANIASLQELVLELLGEEDRQSKDK